MKSPMGGVAACWGFYIVTLVTETVFWIIGRGKQNVEYPKELGIVHRAHKEGKIKKAARGTYVKA